MPNNRIKNSLNTYSGRAETCPEAPAEEAVAPGRTASTQQVYNAAWAMAKRDWELNRLFNAWYYEI